MPGFARAVADFLRREGDQVDRTIAALAAHTPYRADSSE